MPITIEPAGPISDGQIVELVLSPTPSAGRAITWTLAATPETKSGPGVLFGVGGTTDTSGPSVQWDTAGAGGKDVTITAAVLGQEAKESLTVYVAAGRAAQQRPIQTLTKLERSASAPTDDQVLWSFIRNQTNAIGFKPYDEFIEALAGLLATRLGAKRDDDPTNVSRNRGGGIDAACVLARGTYGYDLLRLATQIFLMCRCGVAEPSERGLIKKGGFESALFSENDELARLGHKVTLADLEQKLREYLGTSERLPYLDRILRALLGSRIDDEATIRRYYGLLHARAHCPSLLELIWSYWHEEGMLAQSMNAIAFRFQNKRRGHPDPLARLEIDPLRPLNNLLWGYIQHEYARLSVVRRAYEYDHHYGLTLQGKAVPQLQTADSRSKFLESFHDLLGKATAFYRADADTTVVADAFPILNGLKDLHLVLAEGAHNQFGDLPWTARVEMLVEQWLLARPEMREFLGGRAMVPYAEPWMGQVDTMKKMQGWNTTSVTHFRDLGVFGEQILLSVRYGDWSEVHLETQAKNWARYWKPEVQGYVHAYRAVTGVDLASEPAGEADLQRRRTVPATLIAQRLTPAMPMSALPAAR
jgi:hypothetical protein